MMFTIPEKRQKLPNISAIIADESKRLGFHVEKVSKWPSSIEVV